MKPEIHTTRNPDETADLAAAVLARLPGPAVLALHGDLGSGKTCFVQGLAQAMGITRLVTSPTFTLINEYHGPRPLYHVDLYRLQEPDEAFAFGFEDYLASDGITAIEWAERAGDLLPSDTIHLQFEVGADPDTRTIAILWP